MTTATGKERGAVLITGLIILLVMSLMAVGAMSTTTMQETFSANQQYKAISFQAAESVLRKAWSIPLFGDSMKQDARGNYIDAAVTDTPHAFDSTAKMTVAATARVHYCGIIAATHRTELNADMSAITTAEQWFDTTGDAQMGGAGAHSAHTQGASVLGPVPGGVKTTCTP